MMSNGSGSAPRRTSLGLGAALGVAALLERLWLLNVYAPIEYGDTGSYFRAAAVLARGTLRGLDGTRVPGYPLFVALLGQDPRRVWIGQMALGVGITLLLYVWTLRMSGRPGLAVAVGVTYSLIPALFLFEAGLLTETLTAFLILLSLVLVQSLRRSGADGPAIGAGAAAGAAGLTRILFYPLAVWLVPFVWTSFHGDGRRRWRRMILFTAPAAALLGGWVYFVDSSYGFLSPSTMSGYNLVQHTGVFFEYLPDEYAPLRDTYLRYRDLRLAERGDQTNTIWEAIPELSRVTGLNFYDLSREMQKVSLLLIRQHPDLYLRNVVDGWLDFWKAPVYWDPAQVRTAAARDLIAVWASVGRGLCLAANGVFLLLIAALPFRWPLSRCLRSDVDWWATAGLVASTSILQTLLDHGDNPRFLIPLQMVVFMALAVALTRVLEFRRPRPEVAA